MVVYELGLYEFEDLFKRFDRYDQFGQEGIELLYNYLEDLSDDIGEPVTVDVIGFCCDYTYIDYDDLENYIKDGYIESLDDERIIARGEKGVLVWNF